MRKIKKLVATLLAATMVLAMGVTAFAAENDSTALAAGTYTANQNLYKDAECTNPSMGDAAVNDMWADITINANGKATLVVHTHEIKYLDLQVIWEKWKSMEQLKSLLKTAQVT